MIFKILEPFPEINIQYLNYLEDNWHIIHSFESIISTEKIDGIIIRSKVKIDSNLLHEYKNIKYVLRIWVWIENIDINLLKEKNIILKNTPWANSQAVAELCVWAILGLLRGTYKAFNNIDDRFNFMWSELDNKTIWIVGFWNIWKILYKITNSFWNNNYIIYDPFVNPTDFNYANITFTDNKSHLFKNSDIISFHIPLSEETKNFLWWDDFYLLKKNIKILNSSRWWIINENDLINFLKENPESWAFLDTWEEEPKNPKKDFLDLENCIITPHIWAMTEESNKRMHFFTI